MKNIKKIISIVLGLFVISSIVYWSVDEFRGRSSDMTAVKAVEVENTIRPSKIVRGLYFHGTNRCYTCNLMEGYIRDVLKESFKKETQEGRLTFTNINVDESTNRHYIQDYQLQSISLFLSLQKEGKEVKFQNLDQIWKLAKDESNFKSYIKAEVTKFLEM